MPANTFHKYAAEIRKLTTDFSYATNNPALGVVDPLMPSQPSGYPAVTIAAASGTPGTSILALVTGTTAFDDNVVTCELKDGLATTDLAAPNQYFVTVKARTTQGQDLITVTKIIMRADNEV